MGAFPAKSKVFAPVSTRLILTGLIVTAAGLCAASAQAAGRRIQPYATVRAIRILPTTAVRPSKPVRGAIPLLFRHPRTFAASAPRAGATGPRAGSSGARSLNTAIFGGTTFNQPGLSAAGEFALVGGQPGVTPPDSTGAIGPSSYIEIVNSQIAIWSRTNLSSMVASAGLDVFTGGVQTCDPQIKYDPQSGRWFYSALRCDGTPDQNELYVGWSKQSNPAGLTSSDWCNYAVATSPVTSLDDYDKLGIDAGHIIIGANLFDATSQAFQSAQILVAPKPAAGPITTCSTAPAFTLFGSPASPLRTSIGNLAFTPEPATVSDGTSSAGYLIAADFDDSTNDVSGSHLMLWQVADSTAGTPTLTAVGDVGVSSFTTPSQGVAQPGSSDHIDPMDGRLTQAVMAFDPRAGTGGAEAIWTQHTIDNGSGGTIVRWYEVVPSRMTVRQHNDITSSAGFAFNGAIAPTLGGGAVINYNTGGSTTKVDVEAAARNPADTLGATTALGSPLATSSVIDSDFSCPSQSGGTLGPFCRWGDYAGASADPNCPDVAWGSSQFNLAAVSAGDAQWQAQNFAITPSTNPIQACISANPSPAQAGSPISFSAAQTQDSGGTPSTWSWSFDGGGSTPGTSTTTHTFSTAGLHTVSLTVSDGTNTDTVTTNVNVVGSPHAAFTPSTTSTAVGRPVNFDASASSEPGSTLNYAWNFGDGTTGTGVNPSHSYSTAGNYTVSLTVSDNLGQQDGPATTSIEVVGPISAAFTASPNPVAAGAPVPFDASGSTDPGTTITSYSWNFGDGAAGTGANPTHSYARAGSYLVTLTVGDGFGQGSTASHVVTVVGPPSPSFTAGPSPTSVGSSIAFNAAGSSDPGASITSYSWNFGDGSTGTGVSPSHTYTGAGTYSVTLTVADGYGETATTTQPVTVVGPLSAAFTAPNSALTRVPLTFDAGSSADPGAAITTYSWKFGDGATGTGLHPSHAYRRAGTYTVTLTVGDGYGQTANSTRTVKISALGGRLSIPRGQTLASVARRGLVLVLGTSERVRVRVVVHAAPVKGRGGGSTLIRTRARPVSAGSHRLAPKPSRSASAHVAADQRARLTVKVFVTDSHGNALTLSKTIMLTR